MTHKPLNADAMKALIKRPWCSDPKPMTAERILDIARCQGRFTVHRYLYRADSLRRMCRRLEANALLARGRAEGDMLVYHLPPAKP